MYNRLDRILACDGRTDILPWHSPCYAYASHIKNQLRDAKVIDRSLLPPVLYLLKLCGFSIVVMLVSDLRPV